MRTLSHTHDRERFPLAANHADGTVETSTGTGYAMHEHLLRHHPVLAERLIQGTDGGAGLWPTVSYVDEAHIYEHRCPLWDGEAS